MSNNQPAGCSECGLSRGHKISCVKGNELAARRQGIDLDRLQPVSVAEVAKGPNRTWNSQAKAPDLFEQWWAKNGDKHWSIKRAAREGWYACAKSLGVYDE